MAWLLILQLVITPIPGIQRAFYGDQMFCTTFSIEKHGYWLIPYHCTVNEGEDVNLRIEDRPSLRVKADPTLDLAILKTEKGVKPLHFGKVPTYDDRHKIYEAAGFPLGWGILSVFNGTVAVPDGETQEGRHIMVWQIACGPGSSGSPILDSNGEVVSVIQSGWGTPFAPVCLGPPVEVLKEFTKGYR